VFDRLRYRRQDGRGSPYAFDLLELNGRDMRRERLEVRKRALATVLLRKVGRAFNLMSTATTCQQMLFSATPTSLASRAS